MLVTIDHAVGFLDVRIVMLAMVVVERFGRHVVAKGVLDGLRFEADDIDWVHGTGPAISGRADAVLLAMAGRPDALGHLEGDGVETLRSRLA